VAPLTVTWPVAYLESSYIESQDSWANEVLQNGRKIVQSVAAERRSPTVHTDIENVGPAAALVAASQDAYMTVVASRGLGTVGRAILGSTSSALLHHGHGNIVIVHAEGRPADGRFPVLLGVDGSPASERATALAFDEASRRGVDLVALHAWSDVAVIPILGMDWHEYQDAGREILGERLAGWQEKYPDVHVERRIACDQPSHWLVAASRNAQLVVLGSHGRGGFAGAVLGSVSARVAQTADVPVIVTRPR